MRLSKRKQLRLLELVRKELGGAVRVKDVDARCGEERRFSQ
jgi:hypothetical protein